VEDSGLALLEPQRLALPASNAEIRVSFHPFGKLGLSGENAGLGRDILVKKALLLALDRGPGQADDEEKFNHNGSLGLVAWNLPEGQGSPEVRTFPFGELAPTSGKST